MKKNSILPAFVYPPTGIPYPFAKCLEQSRAADNRILPMMGKTSARMNHARTENGIEFLASQAEWIFLVDTDHIWEPMAITNLLRTALKLKVKAVSGLTFMVKNDGRIIPHAYMNNEEGLEPFVQLPTMEEPFRVDAVGGACFLVHRDVYQTLAAAAPEGTFPWQDEQLATDPNSPSGGLSMRGEDLTFCSRINQAGYEIWYEPRVEFPHMKMKVFGVREYSSFLSVLLEDYGNLHEPNL